MALPVGAALSIGEKILEAKLRAEEERKRRRFEALQSEAQANIAAQSDLARQNQSALGEALGGARSALILGGR